MLDFVNMIGNYQERKVERFENKECIVDTCAVTDSTQPFETAISHASYNDGKWIVVELYPTMALASKGHRKWVKTMTADILPAKLKNVSTAFIALLRDVVAGSQEWRNHNKKQGGFIIQDGLTNLENIFKNDAEKRKKLFTTIMGIFVHVAEKLNRFFNDRS